MSESENVRSPHVPPEILSLIRGMATISLKELWIATRVSTSEDFKIAGQWLLAMYRAPAPEGAHARHLLLAGLSLIWLSLLPREPGDDGVEPDWFQKKMERWIKILDSMDAKSAVVN